MPAWMSANVSSAILSGGFSNSIGFGGLFRQDR